MAFITIIGPTAAGEGGGVGDVPWLVEWFEGRERKLRNIKLPEKEIKIKKSIYQLRESEQWNR